jgi:nucleolin
LLTLSRFGYIDFANAVDAKNAFESRKDTEIDGRRINLDFANRRQSNDPGNPKERAQARSRAFGDQTSPESDTLFVGNIAFSATEDIIHERFNEYGAIAGIRLPTDPDSGRPKGFGYVQFSSVDEARQALSYLQGAELEGRPMRLDFTTPRANQGDSGRGGRGTFGSRGGHGGRGGGRGGSRGGRGGRGGQGGFSSGRGASNSARGRFGDFSGKKTTFD